MTHNPHRARRFRWLAALFSIVLAIAACEALLRFSLFHSSKTFASQDPAYYARTLDELWVYRRLFSTNKGYAVGSGQPDATGDTQIEFYKNWPTSLMPDAQLGYVRKANVRTPCHETTNLATRGTRDYSPAGRKIAFFGDSFVESAACSADTLTTKMERLTGVDTLNFGIGGYGLDQIFLYFQRVLPTLDASTDLFLIGLIQDDLGRVLLQVRTSPKPYYTIENHALALHTDHIHPNALNDYYQRPPERFYLYYFLRGRLGYPVYRKMMSDTRESRQQSTIALSRLLIDEFADMKQRFKLNVAFVVFPTPGAPFDNTVLSLMRAREMPVVDLQRCLTDSERPDRELFAELHPTSLGNELLAQCLVRDLGRLQLLK